VSLYHTRHVYKERIVQQGQDEAMKKLFMVSRHVHEHQPQDVELRS
jgi:hypothetical protein